MPNFHFSKEQTEALVDYLKYVDANAFSYKNTTPNETENNIIKLFLLSLPFFRFFRTCFWDFRRITTSLSQFIERYFVFPKNETASYLSFYQLDFTAATGIIYYYLPEVSGRKFILKNYEITNPLQILILVLVTVFFVLGKFGGREYLEFPPYIVILIVSSWLIFMYNFFMTVKPNYKTVPVYIWS